ncbi:MAG: hypothetical protein HY760_00475 [Nitrospirae bacterium]|nr:hypothetical protein [Nitrospirota bacterium]
METTETALVVGDIVRTRAFGHRYEVVRIDRGRDLAVCKPLSQPHWKDHFMFPTDYLIPMEAGNA